MMTEPSRSKSALNEISHLFLSGVREQAVGRAPRPQRKGPQNNNEPTDLTSEESAHILGDKHPQAAPNAARPLRIAAVIGGGHSAGMDPVRQYARHRASVVGRVALIDVDGDEFRLISFERSEDTTPAESPAVEAMDARHVAEALEEMSVDVNCWLLAVRNSRSAEARTLLKQIDLWVLLCSGDHDGVIGCYRTLKGMADLGRPRLALAVVGGRDSEAERSFSNLSGAAQQFLNWQVESQETVPGHVAVAEHMAMLCRLAPGDSAHTAWDVVSQFLSQHQVMAAPAACEAPAAPPTPQQPHNEFDEVFESAGTPQPVAEPTWPASFQQTERPMAATPHPALTAQPCDVADIPEVLELADGQASEASILAAILAHSGGELVDCPLRPPMCPQARLAVNRQRRLVLLAVAKQGLCDLRTIAQAHRWMTENRSLIGMAVPQLSIDTHALPQLRLLVDHADVSAELLQPLLENGHVLVQSYRKLRWGDKTGVLLEAA